ncbi:transmembrane protein, putative [Medicago truncatula]|uniref:Transmembrane protein, putative n=1 Tax=Medicago truncatula TaxID=3880 RepID=A0A072U7P4_MEDTR|nr:transmembrane protein, putative [Medicago truncatula]
MTNAEMFNVDYHVLIGFPHGYLIFAVRVPTFLGITNIVRFPYRAREFAIKKNHVLFYLQVFKIVTTIIVAIDSFKNRCSSFKRTETFTLICNNQLLNRQLYQEYVSYQGLYATESSHPSWSLEVTKSKNQVSYQGLYATESSHPSWSLEVTNSKIREVVVLIFKL